jgi:drug/metabolite transporter (DMT)-like permease
MKTFLQWLGIVLLFLGTVYMYLDGVVVASFRGDQIVAVYALQGGAIALVSLLIAAVVARAKSKPMRPWLVSFAGLATAVLVATIVSWHIIDSRECPAYPERPGGCFNPQLRELEK